MRTGKIDTNYPIVASELDRGIPGGGVGLALLLGRLGLFHQCSQIFSIEVCLANGRVYCRNAEGAVVFQGVDYFQVWLGLMFKRYDWLASKVVQLGPRQRSREELVGWLRSRTLPISDVAVTQPAIQAP